MSYFKPINIEFSHWYTCLTSCLTSVLYSALSGSSILLTLTDGSICLATGWSVSKKIMNYKYQPSICNLYSIMHMIRSHENVLCMRRKHPPDEEVWWQNVFHVSKEVRLRKRHQAMPWERISEKEWLHTDSQRWDGLLIFNIPCLIIIWKSITLHGQLGWKGNVRYPQLWLQ